MSVTERSTKETTIRVDLTEGNNASSVVTGSHDAEALGTPIAMIRVDGLLASALRWPSMTP